MSMLDEENKEPVKTDELSDIRKEYEQAELEESLKRVLFGGYSKKKVNEVLNTYKEMIQWMQESFDYRLKELSEEKERVWNERVVLKKQLSAELEKNKEIDSLKEEAEYWKQQHENDCAALRMQLRVELEKNKETDSLKEAAAHWEQQYQSVREKYEHSYRELQRVMEEQTQLPPAQGAEDSSTLIAALTNQLEELTSYCESMEKQQKSLETQISSMKNISQELDRLSVQYEENQVELKTVRLKYANAKNENYALNSEMESTGRILEDILGQFEEKEAENDMLRREIDGMQAQLLAVKRDKLTQEQANLSYMERAYTAEKELQEGKEELYRLKKEMEELRRKCDSLENSKVIKIQSMAVPKEEGLTEKERIEGILKRASTVVERAAGQGEKDTDENSVKISVEREEL